MKNTPTPSCGRIPENLISNMGNQASGFYNKALLSLPLFRLFFSIKNSRGVSRPLTIFYSKNNKKMKTLVLTSLMALLLLPSLLAQTTHTVCATGCDFTSIQAAIDAADSGDTIRIFEGVFEEDVDATGIGITLATGNSPACVEIIGDVTLDNTINFLVDINGTAVCTDYDSSFVSGTLDLNGATLDINLDGYVPAVGESFVILEANSLEGMFEQGSSINVDGIDFNVNYDDNRVTLSFCEEPNIDIAVNGETAGFNSSFFICSILEAEITLESINAGDAPFTISWEVLQDPTLDSTVTVENEGDILFSGFLAVGVYTINLSAVVDANGCEIEDLAGWSTTLNVREIDSLMVSCPDVFNMPACLGNQAEIDSAFNVWINEFETEGGCEVSSITDLSNFSAPDTCGGMVEVLFAATDALGTVECSSVFNVSVDSFEVNCPDPVMIDCPLPDSFYDVETAFNIWIGGFSASGGCGNLETTDLSDFFSPNSCAVEIQIDFSAEDECGRSAMCMSYFMVLDTIPCMMVCPDSIVVDPDLDLCGQIVDYEIESTGFCPVNGGFDPELVEGLESGELFPFGLTEVRYEWFNPMDDTLLTCTFPVLVNLPNDPDDEILCILNAQVSVDDECIAILTPDIILPGVQCANDLYVLEVMGRDTNIVTIEDLDQTFEVEVTRLDIFGNPTGNSCMANILVEDKLRPTIICQNDTISCLDTRDFILPLAFDNCGEVEEIRLLNEIPDPNFCDSLFIRRYFREYVAIDSSGNMSDTCTQEILIRQIDIHQIVFPGDLTKENDNPLSCDDGFPVNSEGNPAPEFTGFPTFEGIDLDGTNSVDCNIDVSYTDSYFESSTCKKKISRIWVVNAWRCDGTSVDTMFMQKIEVVDTTAPVLSCIDSISVSTTPGTSCSANIFIERPDVSDNCSDILSLDLNIVDGHYFENWNGGSLSFGIGETIVEFVAYDECLNRSTCETIVTVIDETPPIAVCKEKTVVGLTLDGTARVFAESFNNGSYDECGPVSLEVRRMDVGCDGAEVEFGPHVDFFCCDLEDNPILIVLQVTDESGNTNECMVEIEVQDKLGSTIECPADITVSCEFAFDPDDLSVFGTVVVLEDLSDLQNPALDPRNPIIIDDSGNTDLPQPHTWGLDGYAYNHCEVTVSETSSSTFEECNRGTIIRTFTAMAANGTEAASCSQTIRIENISLFDSRRITWPADVTLENVCIGVDTEPAATGEPEFTTNICENVAFSHYDQVFETGLSGDPVCFKIVRTWTVIDWCQRDNGEFAMWSEQQTIKVYSDIGPEIAECEDILVTSFDPDCGGAFVELTQSATHECFDEFNLRWSYTIDLDNDGEFNHDQTSNPFADRLNPTNASGEYPIGTHRIVWTVQDDCNNKTTCQQIFEVRNATQPKVICNSNLKVELTGVDTTGNNEFDFGMHKFNAENVNLHSFHPCGFDLSFAFSPDPADSIMVFDCNDYHNESVVVMVYAIAENGSYDRCAVTIFVQDNMNACENSGGSSGGGQGLIAGTIAMEDGRKVGAVEVSLEGSSMDANMTQEDGDYLFAQMSYGGSYEVVPFKDDNPLAGVTTYDIALIQRHILGIRPFESPYQWIAADIDNNGSVDVRDVSQLRRLILGTSDHFANNTSWRFVDADYQFSAYNPLTEDFDETYRIPVFDRSMPGVDFVGVKIGDVDMSVDPSGLHSSSSRSGNQLSLVLENRSFEAEEMMEIEVLARDFRNVDAMQFTLLFDNELILLADLQSAALDVSIENIGIQKLAKGVVPFSWNDVLPTTVSDDEVLFVLRFKAQKAGQLSDVLEVSSYFTESISYVDGRPMGTSLEFYEIVDDAGHFELFQNKPNPFNDQTTIGFNIAENADATLTIFDMNGRVMKVIENHFTAGYNEIRIDNVSEWPSQIYYYRLDTEGFSATRRMLLVN